MAAEDYVDMMNDAIGKGHAPQVARYKKQLAAYTQGPLKDYEDAGCGLPS